MQQRYQTIESTKRSGKREHILVRKKEAKKEKKEKRKGKKRKGKEKNEGKTNKIDR